MSETPKWTNPYLRSAAPTVSRLHPSPNLQTPNCPRVRRTLAASPERGNMNGMRRLLCLALAGLGACATSGASARSLHYVDETLVYSNPPSALAYEAYLRARVELSAEPPRLEQARSEIEVALHYDRRAPHLWSTRAEIAALQGDDDAAVTSAERALALRPGYAPAQAVLASVRGGPRAAHVPD